MLEIKNLVKTYKNGDLTLNALDDVSMSFKEGDFTAILGESGSGKSTFLNIVSGLDSPTSGTVTIDGIDTSKFSDKQWAIYRNHYVGFIFQEYNLLPDLKIVENVELPLLLQGVNKGEARRKALEKIELLGLSKHAYKEPAKLSGGQQQRASIARALVTDPKVIMADEPTGALDSALSNKVMEFLKKVCADKIIILVTHDEELAESHANRIVRLSDGKVISDSSPVTLEPSKKQNLEFKVPKMKNKTIFKFAMNNITSKLIRTLFTCLIVSIGFVAITLLLFSVLGLKNATEEVFGANIPSFEYQVKDADNIFPTKTQIDDISHIDGISESGFKYSSEVVLDTHEGYLYTEIVALKKVEANNNFDKIHGRLPKSSNEIFLTEAAAANIRQSYSYDADELFELVNGTKIIAVNPNNIDEYVQFTIVGMLESEASGIMGLFSEATIFVSYEGYESLSTNNPNFFPSDKKIGYLHFDNKADKDKIINKVETDYDLLVIDRTEDATDKVFETLDEAYMYLLIIASTSLFSAGILIAVVIYTSIVERTKEIGILSAIGAKRQNIVRIFTYEAAGVGFISALIAVILAVLIALIVNQIFDATVVAGLNLLGLDYDINIMSINIFVILGILVASTLFAVLCSVAPTLLISSKKTITALRKE